MEAGGIAGGMRKSLGGRTTPTGRWTPSSSSQPPSRPGTPMNGEWLPANGILAVGDDVHLTDIDCSGVVRYVGKTKALGGTWLGIELDHPAGRSDGSLNGERLFTCKQDHGHFITAKSLSVLKWIYAS